MSSSDQASDSDQSPFGVDGSTSHIVSVPLILSGPADLGPPSKTPPPNTVAVHYNPEEAMSESALASIDVDALAIHEMTEVDWNRDIHKLIDLSLGPTLARGVPFRLHCKSAQSLWDIKLSASATPFRDVPAQRRIAEIVLRNRLKKEVRVSSSAFADSNRISVKGSSKQSEVWSDVTSPISPPA